MSLSGPWRSLGKSHPSEGDGASKIALGVRRLPSQGVNKDRENLYKGPRGLPIKRALLLMAGNAEAMAKKRDGIQQQQRILTSVPKERATSDASFPDFVSS